MPCAGDARITTVFQVGRVDWEPVPPALAKL